ncbi:hypothetical protein GGR52DRAFT_570994 [Hypoxylon sp. FL1284]|nr:hypothetical protein GGR52DRAFT_570994 [Hypoxylon sp. FL1284]
MACSIGIFLLYLWNQHYRYHDRVTVPSPIGGGNVAASHHPSVITSTATGSHKSLPGLGPEVEEEDGASAIDLSDPRAPFISWPLQRVCAEVEAEGAVVPGLTFLCDNNSGGPGNIRNYVLTCMRYALAAGASGLVMPTIRARDPADPARLFRGSRSFAYMFDEPHFRASLEAACPRIAIYASPDDVPGARAKAQREGRGTVDRVVETATPKHFGGARGGCDQRDPHRYADGFGAAFRAYLRASAAERGWPEPGSAGDDGNPNPRLIRLSWGVLWDWPVLRDGPEFAASFGGLLRFRADVLDIADVVADAMRRRAASRSAENGGETAKFDRSFLGIHLRTEADALARWPSYENQTAGYLREAAARGYRGAAAYLASGDETEAARFAADAAAELGLEVRTKYGALEATTADDDGAAVEALERLRELSWDQQALVDFAVLLRCGYFVGVSPSSFSINVALKRHLRDDGLRARPWRVGGPGDGRSWLVGRYNRYWEDWLFMFDGMWP